MTHDGDLQPLYIRWRLSSPWVPPAFGLHFDGLLAWAVVDEAIANGATSGNYDELLAHLPLARYETPAGWCWKASYVRPVKVLGSERRHMVAKTPTYMIGRLEEEMKAQLIERGLPDKMKGGAAVDTVRGFYKAASFYVPLQHVVALEAYCVGDPGRISELLLRVNSIGAKGRIGFGTVAEVRDSNGETALDFTVAEDEGGAEGWRYRVLPQVAADEQDRYIPVEARLQPPYWQGTGTHLAYRPIDFA